MSKGYGVRSFLAAITMFGLLSGSAGAQSTSAGAASYPNKTIKIIVPYPAGGTTDVLARMVGNDLSTAWKTTVIVENKPGASGMIGNDLVAKAAPDGYTILMGIATLLQGPHMFSSIPYDFKRDLIPLALVAKSTNLLVIPARFPAKNFEEFVKVVKANPGKYSYGSYGAGTTAHIHGETLKNQAGLDMIHVPYKGGSPLMTDMLGGQLDAAFIDVGNVKASLKSDKIRIIAITGEERLKLIPEVRTLTEVGFKDFEPYPFFALYLPAGTPQPIVDKLGKEINSIILNPANRAKIEELGLQPSGQIGQQFKDTVTRDYDTWGNVIKAGKIKLEQ